jgi:ribosomal protein S18 acetylase RimI-like enzyme
MLVEGFAWRPGSSRPAVGELLANSHAALYVEDWGRPGDAGVIAEEDGQPVGACWYRLFTVARHGYGFVGESVPELSLAVREHARGRGVGTDLIDAIADVARSERLGALSLSVEEENPALRLYERAGFERVELAGNAWTMQLQLARP